MPLIDIRTALVTDLTDIQSCARLAYSKYISRIGREPAPMHADYASLVGYGYIDVAILDSHFVGYVVFYPEAIIFTSKTLPYYPSMVASALGSD